MPSDSDPAVERVRAVFSRYSETLLRGIVARLIKPRNPIPVEELVERCLAALTNPPVVDRRISEMEPAARKTLALFALGRRSNWKVGHILTALASLGNAEGTTPIIALLEQGLLVPDLAADAPILESFESWLGAGDQGIINSRVLVLPSVATRARHEDLGLPKIPSEKNSALTPRIADGLDWILRLSLVRQQVSESPVRLTQSGALFKRDMTRLQSDEVLNASPADAVVPIPDPGILSLFWSEAAGLSRAQGVELLAEPYPSHWSSSTPTVLSEIWGALLGVESWDPVAGYVPRTDNGGTPSFTPFPTVALLSLLLLARAEPGAWVEPQQIADYVWEHHPTWQGVVSSEVKTRGRAWIEAFLFGVLFPLRLVEAAHQDGWKARLSDVGLNIVGGPEPREQPAFPQTLLVQPNAEILAYRQGLTPGLIGRLTRFAQWKNLGPACTLELTPERTYHALESGLTPAGIIQTLNQHGMKPVPPAVDDLLRRWADKRERITLFVSATLVEFQTPADLDAAIARGIVSVRVSDRIGVTDDGTDPDFKSLRLIGNRDYDAKPRRCVSVGEDGVTLTIDTAQSDLLLEAEIGRLSDPVLDDPPGVRRVRMSAATLARATTRGWSIADLDEWFMSRAGTSLPPAGRLFLLGPAASSPKSEHLLVVRMESADLVDGVVQWPPTRELISERLGPKVVAVTEDNLPLLKTVLSEIGITLG